VPRPCSRSVRTVETLPHRPPPKGDLSARARACQRPGCALGAAATLTYRYDSRETWILPLAVETSPHAYDLCVDHAARTIPPHGWSLRDDRGVLARAVGQGWSVTAVDT
jgi:hypothetical protein